MNMNSSLDSFEWHDLPIESFSILPTGISLVITPYSEVSDSYNYYHFKIEDVTSLKLDIQGDLPPKDLASLEVFSFYYVILADGRLDGSIEILPGNAGFWTVTFRNAAWSLSKQFQDEEGFISR